VTQLVRYPVPQGQLLRRSQPQIILPVAGPAGNVYDKTGTAAAQFVGSGADVTAFAETVAGVSAFTGSGADAFTAAETGAGVSPRAASGADAHTAVETGTGTSAFVATGADVHTAAETGAGVSAFGGSGADTSTTAETGAGVSALAGSGADAFTAAETGLAVSAFAAAGADAFTAAETGTGVSTFTGSGVKAYTQVGKTGIGKLEAGPRVGVDFDGTTAYMQATDSTSLRVEANNAFSWAFWTLLDSYNNNVLPRFWEKRSHYVCVMGDSANGKYRQVALEIADSLGVAHEYWGRVDLNTGLWTHIAGTYDGATDTCRQWVNGTEDTVDEIHPGGAWGGTLQSTTGIDFYLARRRTDLLRNLDGKMAEFRLWNRALAPSEIVDAYTGVVAASGLIARWDLDEGRGVTVTDDSGNANTGTLTSPVWLPGSGVDVYTAVETGAGLAAFAAGGADVITVTETGVAVSAFTGGGTDVDTAVETGTAIAPFTGGGVETVAGTGNTYTKAGLAVIGP
jgi:hypothetical protein